jgi:hypothetical protein
MAILAPEVVVIDGNGLVGGRNLEGESDSRSSDVVEAEDIHRHDYGVFVSGLH